MFSLQSWFIYLPRRYTPEDYEGAPPSMKEIVYTTTEGSMTAYYVPARGEFRRLWVVFNGNGGTALGWRHFARDCPASGAAFLLVDYPGYGVNEGRPAPWTIQESAEEALRATAREFDDRQELSKSLCVLGHSLGAATGLAFAARHPDIQRVIAVSPFTSMRSMARRTVGWPLCLLLTHHFDNDKRLGEMAARRDPPDVFIVHGTADDVIPVSMGKELAALHPRMIRFIEIPGADHNALIDEQRERLYGLMEEH